jgi:glycosyltransferase involved in cell wall biosynthesis
MGVTLSFIIPAYNEDQLLGATLEAIRESAETLGEPYEIIVADDASTDDTARVAKENGARVVTVDHRQITATRNSGADAATGSMLIFVDADTLVTSVAVRAAVVAMREGAAGGGCAFHFEGRLPIYARVLARLAVPAYRLLKLASGCFLFCTREAFDAVGGFDETLFAAEEAVMSRALRRHGKFVVLKESVATSGRKLRSFSAREILGTLARLAIGGSKSLKSRNGLEIWYGERQPDG